MGCGALELTLQLELNMIHTRSLSLLQASVFAACAVFATTSQAASFQFDEASDGDLSGNVLAPTLFGNSPSSLGFAVGSNTILGQTSSGDYDLINFTVGAGQQLSAIKLVSYSSTDVRGFIAVQEGAVWANGLGGAGNFDVSTLLGYSHFGTHVQAPQPGTDVLDNLGASGAGGAIGFSGPLGPGSYTFLIQQTGPAVISYGFDFQLTAVPEPGESVAMAGLLLGGFGVWRRLRRSRA